MCLENRLKSIYQIFLTQTQQHSYDDVQVSLLTYDLVSYGPTLVQ